MLSSYDLTNFSNKLKSIRKSLGFSQFEVSNKTGINSDTLRRLENGMSIPRFDTLEVLSQFYKVNLIIILDSYKSSSQLSYFYDLVDFYIVNEDVASIPDTILLFEHYIKSNEFQMFDSREIEQLKLFFKGLELSLSTDIKLLDKSLDFLISALRISNPMFKIEIWDTFKFNFLELRILFNIASIEGFKRNCELSNKIILFILNYLDSSSYSKFYERMLIVKSFSIISYNYHRLDQHPLALEFSEKGIKFCVDHSIMAYLHLLLFRKGTAMFHLQIEGFRMFIEQSIELLKIQNKDNIADSYAYYLDKYIQEFIPSNE